VSTIYCLDTSVFINSWNKHYPFDLFPCFWDHIHDLLFNGKAIVPKAVFDEVHEGGDDLYKWLDFHRRDSVVNPDAQTVAAAKAIVQAYKRLLEVKKSRTGSGADPLVIACAQIKSATVVIEEQASGSLIKPKVPDVCKAMGIKCIRTVEMLRECKVSFNAKSATGGS
jgi:hypothetical protein